MLRLSTALLLAATCLLFRAGFSGATMNPLTVVTCDLPINVHRLSCESGFISVQTARLEPADAEICSGKRFPNNHGHKNCSEDILPILRNHCDRKKVCEVTTHLNASDLCPGIKKYLETTHTCTPAIRSVTCERSMTKLQCDEKQSIVVYGADYGRRDSTTCSYQRPASQIQDVDCVGPTNEVAKRCEGKRSCVLSAVNSVFGDPCVGTYKYLEVDYDCMYHTVACERDMAHLKCDHNLVIFVYKAVYGRNSLTTCPAGARWTKDHNCSGPALKVVRQICDGNRACAIKASNSQFGDPCPGTYKYLEVTYKCVDPAVL